MKDMFALIFELNIRAIFGVYWGHMGIMEEKMETLIMGYVGFRAINNFELTSGGMLV